MTEVLNTERKQRITLRKIKVVMAQTGYSPSSIYRLMAEGKFPKPIKLSERQAMWIGEEIDEWIATKKAERDEAIRQEEAAKTVPSEIVTPEPMQVKQDNPLLRSNYLQNKQTTD